MTSTTLNAGFLNSLRSCAVRATVAMKAVAIDRGKSRLPGLAMMISVAATATALIGSAALAGQGIEERRATEAGARISVSMQSGQIEVVGGDRDDFVLTGILGDDVETLEIDGTSKRWRIEVKPRSEQVDDQSASNLTLAVPSGIELEMRLVAADAVVRNLSGASVRVNSVSGDVAFEEVRPDHVAIETASGDQVGDSGGRRQSRFRTRSGSIRFENLIARVEASSGSGDVDIEGSRITEANLETVSGEIRARIEPEARAKMKFATDSGPVDLRLPSGVAITLLATSATGSIDSTFGGPAENADGTGPRLEFRSGSGGVSVEVASSSGPIVIGSTEESSGP